MNKNNLDDIMIWHMALLADKELRYSSESAFLQFKQRVNMQKTCLLTASNKKKGWKTSVSWLRYVAIISVVIMIAAMSWHLSKISMQKTFTNIVIESPAGSTTLMILPDGTKVQLAPSSRITYSQGFGINDRNIQLEGEARFEVAHDDACPMTVVSSSLSILDLGTIFVFSDYTNDSEAFVSLSEGSVSVAKTEKDAKPQKLEPGQKLLLDKESGQINVVVEEDNSINDFTSPILYFKGEPLYKMARRMERMYGVTISIENEDIMNLRFHGRFDTRHQSAIDILQSLSATGKLKYKNNGDLLIIY